MKPRWRQLRLRCRTGTSEGPSPWLGAVSEPTPVLPSLRCCFAAAFETADILGLAIFKQADSLAVARSPLLTVMAIESGTGRPPSRQGPAVAFLPGRAPPFPIRGAANFKRAAAIK